MGDWRAFLGGVSEAVPQDGASPEEIEVAERRLGTTLPPGYRSFLETTNGFGPIGHFVRRLRPVAEICWLRDEDPELIQIWVEATGDDALSKTLVVSDEEDGARVLLNPVVVDEEGEWEAWFLAHWVPGRSRTGRFEHWSRRRTSVSSTSRRRSVASRRRVLLPSWAWARRISRAWSKPFACPTPATAWRRSTARQT
jgi:hypothetical protein